MPFDDSGLQAVPEHTVRAFAGWREAAMSGWNGAGLLPKWKQTSVSHLSFRTKDKVPELLHRAFSVPV